MKRYIPIIIAALTLLTAIGCKTTEENYRTAYQRAKENERAGIDSTIYSRIRQEARPRLISVDGDTVGMRSEYVSVTEGQPNITADILKRYSVVVAQFKQLFHAKSVSRRFVEAGHAGTFIVQTREPLYYVVAFSTPDITAARDTLLKIQSTPPFTLQPDAPWLLRVPNR